MNVTFTGDISITGSFTENVSNNLEIFDDNILTSLKKADFVVGNLEGPVTNLNKIYNYNTPLKSPINTITFLNKRNISIFNLANNHILDYGELGLKNTLGEIKKEKCTYFGADLTLEKTLAPLIIHKNGISIALFGITKCTPTKINTAQLFAADDFTSLKKQIKLYKNKVDFIIVNFHGGEEFSLYPSPTKRKYLKKITKLKGVSCVIAHHSHTLQGYERYNNKYIFYSLGNFIFDIPNHKPYKNTNHSALLNLQFSKTDFTFCFIPFAIKKGEIVAINKIGFEKKMNSLCDFTNYNKKWQMEAYRLLFRKENPNLKETLYDKKSLQNKSLFAVICSKKFYKKIIAILKDEYLFSLYVNAILYKIKKKFVL